MPLIKKPTQAAFKANVKTLMGEVGESPNVQSQKQALAIAYDIKRKRRAIGGSTFAGPIVSSVPGRTDDHPMEVGSGSYVLPADHVSSLGQGNTLAGMDFLKKLGAHGIKKMVTRLPGAPKKPSIPRIGAKRRKFALGGSPEDTAGAPVPINAAGGEHVIPPEEVAIIGDGDLQYGHALLDHWVVSNRKNHVNTLRKLPGPAQD